MTIRSVKASLSVGFCTGFPYQLSHQIEKIYWDKWCLDSFEQLWWCWNWQQWKLCRRCYFWCWWGYGDADDQMLAILNQAETPTTAGVGWAKHSAATGSKINLTMFYQFHISSFNVSFYHVSILQCIAIFYRFHIMFQSLEQPFGCYIDNWYSNILINLNNFLLVWKQ